MKRNAARPLLCTIALAAALGACGRAEPEPEADAVVVPVPPPAANQARAAATAEERREFVADAAEVWLAQIEAARLATMRTEGAAVKAFAEQMERENAQMHDELQRIAREQGIDVPATVAGEMRTRLDELAAESGAEFDRRYVRNFGVEGHLKAIELFERQAIAGQDAELRAFAERSLPVLQQHLAAAQRLGGGA